MPRVPVHPDAPLREALLLLPALPATAAVHGPLERWAPALAAWGLVPGDDAAGLAVGSQAQALARSGAEQVLLEGRDRHRALVAAGYAVTGWRVGRTRHGTAALVPGGDASLGRLLRTGGRRRRPRQLAADLVRRARGDRWVTVGVRHDGLPLALQSLPAPPARVALLLGTASARRRPVFLVGASGRCWERVVKVGSGEQAAQRAHDEQRMLVRLAELGLPGVPVALGSGTAGRLRWSAESALSGTPLLDVLAELPPAQGLGVLAHAADHLTALAAATLGPRAADSGLRLRGPHRAAAQLVPPDVPGVLVHGDVPGNSLLDAGEVRLLDWETARFGGLPLHDLLPLLCLGLAAVRRVPQQQAGELLLSALRGRSGDSPWLLDQVRRSLHRLGVPLHSGGALAATSLASWASMRLVHDELVRSSGGQVTPWVSPAERLAPVWQDDPALGPDWPALVAGS